MHLFSTVTDMTLHLCLTHTNKLFTNAHIKPALCPLWTFYSQTDGHKNASALSRSTIHNLKKKISKDQKLEFIWWNWKAKCIWSSWNKERQIIWYWGSKTPLKQTASKHLVRACNTDDVWSLVHHCDTLEVFNGWEDLVTPIDFVFTLWRSSFGISSGNVFPLLLNLDLIILVICMTLHWYYFQNHGRVFMSKGKPAIWTKIMKWSSNCSL